MAARRKYPWEAWFGARRTTLRYGVDYNTSQSTMCQTVRNNASRRGLRVRIDDTGNGISIEVVGSTAREISHPNQAAVTR